MDSHRCESEAGIVLDDVLMKTHTFFIVIKEKVVEVSIERTA